MRNLIKKGQLGFIATLLLVFIVSACDKEDAAISQEILEETAFAENVFAQLSSDVDDAVPFEGISSGRHGGGFGFGFGDCMTRTVASPEESDYPKTITIEYDGECSSGLNGVVKSGKIIIMLTGHPSDEGSQRIVTFEDFTVNGNIIEGTKTITFDGSRNYSCKLDKGKIRTSDGKVIVRESTKTRTLIAGEDTQDRSDDVYEVTGTILGETTGGLSYKKEIIEPLIVSKSCFWISKGVVETTIGDASSTVDFGDGTCDNLATRIDADGEEEFTMDMRVRKMWKHKKQKK